MRHPDLWMDRRHLNVLPLTTKLRPQEEMYILYSSLLDTAHFMYYFAFFGLCCQKVARCYAKRI